MVTLFDYYQILANTLAIWTPPLMECDNSVIYLGRCVPNQVLHIPELGYISIILSTNSKVTAILFRHQNSQTGHRNYSVSVYTKSSLIQMKRNKPKILFFTGSFIFDLSKRETIIFNLKQANYRHRSKKKKIFSIIG